MLQRLRKCYEIKQGPFSGPVEFDEAFFGGLESNKHASKKLKKGRGAVGKTVVVGAKDRETGRIVTRQVESTDRDTLHDFVHTYTIEGATVYTDEHASYKGINRPHTAVKHSVNEFVNGLAHTNGMESFGSTLKAGYKAIYKHMSPTHLYRYANEFAGRQSDRDLDTVDMMGNLVRGAVGKRLTYKELTS